MARNQDEIDCLFVHVTKKTTGNESCRYLARGVLALSDMLERNGVASKIIHLGVEKSVNPDFDIVEYIKRHRVKMLALSVHWNHQLFSALDLVKKVKTELPDIKIVIGGFTATLFAKEIMENFEDVDYVIRGDAELPMLSLAEFVIKNQRECSGVPNLVWRKKNSIAYNGWTYTTSQKTLNKLRFSNFELLENFEYYLRGYFDAGASGSLRNILRYLAYGKIFFLVPSRGCHSNCSFCGGSAVSQRLTSKRRVVLWKSARSVIRDLIDSKKYGVNTLWIVSDQVTKREYYQKIFEHLRKKHLKFRIVFECYSLPSREFVDEIRAASEGTPLIILSPESDSERIRKLNKGLFYSNENLFKTLDYLEKMGGIKVELCFTVGLPFQKIAGMRDMIEFCKAVIEKYRSVYVRFASVEVDPASPMHLNPSKYGVSLKRRDFSDFYDYSKKTGYDVGYSTRYFSKNEIANCEKIIGDYFLKVQLIGIVEMLLRGAFVNIRSRFKDNFGFFDNRWYDRG